MSENKSPNLFPLFGVILSLFGTFTLTFLLFQSVNYQSNVVFTHTLIGSLYAAICILGISAVFYPKKCQGAFNFQKSIKSSRTRPANPKMLEFEGHHPSCSKFSPNRIKIRKTILCAACGGLLVGALGALIGAILYFFVGYSFLGPDPWVLVAGYTGMFLGLFQYKFAGYVKLAVNAFFVLSSSAILITVDKVGKSLIIDLYAFGLIVLILSTRIALSERNNKRTCNQCKQCF